MRASSILLVLYLGKALAQNESTPASVIEEMLLPLLFGFLIKIVFVLFAALFKLLIVGIASLGTSGLSLVLAVMLAKRSFDKLGLFGFDKGWNLRAEKGLIRRHAVPKHLSHVPSQLHNYRSDVLLPYLYKPLSKHSRSRAVPNPTISPVARRPDTLANKKNTEKSSTTAM